MEKIYDIKSPVRDDMLMKANRIVDNFIQVKALGADKKYSDEDYKWAQKILEITTPPIEYFGY